MNDEDIARTLLKQAKIVFGQATHVTVERSHFGLALILHVSREPCVAKASFVVGPLEERHVPADMIVRTVLRNMFEYLRATA